MELALESALSTGGLAGHLSCFLRVASTLMRDSSPHLATAIETGIAQDLKNKIIAANTRGCASV